MKKSFIFFLLLSLAWTININAQDEGADRDFIAKSELGENQVITVHLANLQQKLTLIRLTDIDEKTEYYKETIKDHNGFAKDFNLKKLKNGTYLIKVTQGEKMMKQVVRIRGNEILFSEFS